MPSAPAIAPDTGPVPANRPLGLQLALTAVAALEAFAGLAGIPTLFADIADVTGPGIGGFLIKAHLATQPVLALTALAFATLGRPRGAIIALAAIMVSTWLNDMPSVVRHGFDVGGLSNVLTPIQIIGFPLMAACAIACAVRNQRLGLATLLVSAATLFNTLMVVAFGISVAIFGF